MAGEFAATPSIACDAMKELGEPTWFSVGDRDLAPHLLRTKLISQGSTFQR